ncbi:hypothetical protein MACH26_25480 [Planctobacterium marinum]|uniref:TonB-dependent receptor plug domain-containing protein n=1 Tax=Planctobacterium marinum TaxID=1631968 RepID=A0AA48HP19_9ALTE|nr:hypothetical protein MACH26_25480 [Planctobacterium marinum]
MYRVTKIAAMLASILPVSLMAQTLQGVVQDKDGSAVANAEVEIEGIGKTVVTDDSGRFEVDGLPEGINELHIVAPGFAHLHQDINVTEQQDLSMTFTVQRSAIEVIDIVATPIHMSAMESAAPVSVLGGEALRRQQAATLGDSLEKIAGVHTNFHANVASTPVIRGLSGPRVLIAQNGLDVSDVSRVGPDHAVASEASTAQQIEVLRGPATLFYGSGAIGGVVNVVDGRIPLDNTTRGEWLLESNSVDEKNSLLLI